MTARMAEEAEAAGGGGYRAARAGSAPAPALPLDGGPG